MGVLDYLQRLVNQLGYTLNLVASILGTLITSGWYIVVRDAATVTTDIHGLLEDPTCGQEAQCTKLNSIITTTDDIVTLLNDLSTLVAGTRVVNLPSPAPTGYGGSSASDTADAVWNYGTGHSDFSFTLDALTNAANLAVNLSGTVGFRTPSSMTVALVGPFGGRTPGSAPGFFDAVDPATILPTDTTVLAWLQREYSPAWTQFFGQPYPHSRDSKNLYSGYVLISQPEFEFLRALNAGTALPTAGAPVWPGLANVTLGTPVAFSGSTLSVTGPMDGVIVTITAVNQPLPHYSYGTAVAWGKLGGLTFVDDNGDAEEYQLFGFVDAVYVPRAMVQADSCQIRNVSGIVGTVTPWTKS